MDLISESRSSKTKPDYMFSRKDKIGSGEPWHNF